MDFDTIDRLARLVKDLDLSEIEIRRLGERIRIVGHRPVGSEALRELHQNSTGNQRIAGILEPERSTALAPLEEAQDMNDQRKHDWVPIKAPMVGTFYRAPAPDAPPYAEIGQTLEIGQTVCIIEAMKLMNEIHSDVRGRIVSILVENAQPVEFGQTLIEVDPSATS
jgi:acetyl-CoA carboxylase biotin carboxyl carrier protein